MFSISDIFKKHKKTQTPAEPQEKPPTTVEKPSVPAEKPTLSLILDNKGPAPLRTAKAEELYNEALGLVREAYEPRFVCNQVFLERSRATIAKMTVFLSGDGSELLRICVGDYPSLPDYFCFHVVNVCIIAVQIGLWLAKENIDIQELGLAAFLHDIGLRKYLDTINKKEKLSAKELQAIRRHPLEGAEFLREAALSLNKNVLDTVLHEHERLDGSGYPAGIKADEINRFAQIVGLADVYEALTHQRPYRKKFSSLDAIKEILDHKSGFDRLSIKSLIRALGIFPIGTPVYLNTKEQGIVVSYNHKLPFRPLLKILRDVNGNELKEPKQLDLSLKPKFWIEGCVS